MSTIRFEELQRFPICKCCGFEEDQKDCPDCRSGDCGNEDCEQAHAERQWERFVEAYYGGDQPITQAEQHQAAWKQRRVA